MKENRHITRNQIEPILKKETKNITKTIIQPIINEITQPIHIKVKPVLQQSVKPTIYREKKHNPAIVQNTQNLPISTKESKLEKEVLSGTSVMRPIIKGTEVLNAIFGGTNDYSGLNNDENNIKIKNEYEDAPDVTYSTKPDKKI